MKIILLLLCLSQVGCVFATPPTTKYTVQLFDAETDQIITNAVIRTGFKQKRDPWGIGGEKSNRVIKKPNKDGVVTFSGKTINYEQGGIVFSDNYYPSRFWKRYKINKILNRWEPWNPTITVKLRPKKDPVPMVHKNTQKKKLRIPVFDKLIGFDLEVGDWVAPYGKGKIADFVVKMNRRFKHSQDYDASLEISFSNKSDGIQLFVLPEKFTTSSYKFAYKAPLNQYKNKWIVEKHARLGSFKSSPNGSYIFRVRTKIDKKGKIISACYGRINQPIEIGWGDVFYINYSLNLNSKSRSLESKNKPY